MHSFAIFMHKFYFCHYLQRKNMGETLEIAGTIVGIIYLWLEYKASIYLWIASIIMPAVYLIVYYQAGLYADFGINIYYLAVAIYGWWVWKYGSIQADGQPRTELPITHLPHHKLLPLGLLFLSTFLLIAFVLIHFTDSNVPWLDSFTTALSIIGMWLLARKYLEQWWVWIAVDVVSAGLYLYKGLYFTASLYALYSLIAVFGYYKWKKTMLS